jgi:hypothetical protein
MEGEGPRYTDQGKFTKVRLQGSKVQRFISVSQKFLVKSSQCWQSRKIRKEVPGIKAIPAAEGN